jgi:hypothetical protein
MDSDPYAVFASLAYQTPEQRFASINEMNTSPNAASLSTWVIDPYFNTDEAFAMVDSRGGQVIVSHRGTAGLSDVQTDIALALGSLERTDRYKRALAFSQDVSEAYAGYSILEVGHSLGGTLADSISRRLGHQSSVYNQGSSPFHTAPPPDANHKRYRTSEDFISSFAPSTATLSTHSHRYAQRMRDARMRNGALGFLIPETAASRVYSAYTGHLLSNFFG